MILLAALLCNYGRGFCLIDVGTEGMLMLAVIPTEPKHSVDMRKLIPRIRLAIVSSDKIDMSTENPRIQSGFIRAGR
jgi:hypothetical protein